MSRFVLVAFTALLLGGCAGMIPGSDYERVESSALANPQATKIGQLFAAEASAHPGKSAFKLLPVGLDGFAMRMQMIERAERTIDLQYYIVQEDDTGRLLTDALLSASDRDVRVRILLDDATTTKREATIHSLAAHPQIQVRLFNPYFYRGYSTVIRGMEFVTNSTRLDYRMHNKLLVVDNAMALAGGRNIGNEYFQVGGDVEFGDYDIFGVGPIVARLSAEYDTYWKSRIVVPIEALNQRKPSAEALAELRKSLDVDRTRLADTEYVLHQRTGEPLTTLLAGKSPLVWAEATVIFDSPDKAKVEKGEIVGRLMHRTLAVVTAAAKSEIIMVSPYLVPGPEGLALLQKKRSENVRVRILTNSMQSNDVPIAQSGYMRYRDTLVDDGVELFEVRPSLGSPGGSGGYGGSGGKLTSGNAERFALHAKVFVFDRQRIFIGSMNFDQRSLHLNTELGLLIESPELAQQVAARFEAIAQPANSYQVINRPDNTSPQRRIVWRTEENKMLVEHEQEPAANFCQRMRVNIYSWLPLDSEL
ncbi:MAG: phospholipase D family protein [Betaproteobacteria bacterium]